MRAILSPLRSGNMFELATETVLLLAVAAFTAGFVDAIAGGGGLIVIPSLLLAGLTPLQALATNKLQGLFGSGSATITYASRGLIDFRRHLPSAAMSLVGSIGGALVASLVPGQWLQIALPLMLVAIALYFAFKPNMDDVDRAQRLSPLAFALVAALGVGFYDGVFGPGAGSFFMLAYVTLAGFGMLKATAHTKLLNFASNIGAFAAFAFTGAILWKIGLLMGVAQFLGARLGATMAIRNGSRIIKPLLVIVCVALAIRLLIDPANPIHVWLVQ